MTDDELIEWLFKQNNSSMAPPSDYKWRIIRLFQILLKEHHMNNLEDNNGRNTKAQLD